MALELSGDEASGLADTHPANHAGVTGAAAVEIDLEENEMVSARPELGTQALKSVSRVPEPSGEFVVEHGLRLASTSPDAYPCC